MVIDLRKTLLSLILRIKDQRARNGAEPGVTHQNLSFDVPDSVVQTQNRCYFLLTDVFIF